MAERPILFNAVMVRAILAGRKTQTRRPLRAGLVPERLGETMSKADWRKVNRDMPVAFGAAYLCPFGQPGDQLWVRETWMDLTGTGIGHWDTAGKPMRYAYGAESPPGSASDEARKDFGLKWRPSIHMPREACRLVLEITGVRVERLQAISDSDALAEGIEELNGRYSHNGGSCKCRTPAGSFHELWTSTGGDWDSNPWVWVIEFKRIDSPQGVKDV